MPQHAKSVDADRVQSNDTVAPRPDAQAGMPLETEVKFIVPAERVLDRMQAAGHLAGCAFGPVRVAPQRDLYFDTGAYALLHRGMSLRYRQVGDAHMMTFKRPSTISHTRVEIEDDIGGRGIYALTDGLLQDLDAPAARAAIPWVGPERISPMLLVANRRSSSLLESPAARVKVCSDRVEYTPCMPGYDGFAVEYELELELQDGSELFLEQLAQAVAEEYGLAIHSHSKYERGMYAFDVPGSDEEPAPATPSAPSMDHSAWRSAQVEGLKGRASGSRPPA